MFLKNVLRERLTRLYVKLRVRFIVKILYIKPSVKTISTYNTLPYTKHVEFPTPSGVVWRLFFVK